MARAHMPMFTASCGRTRMIVGPPPSCGRVLSVPAPTMAAGYTTAGAEAIGGLRHAHRGPHASRSDAQHRVSKDAPVRSGSSGRGRLRIVEPLQAEFPRRPAGEDLTESDNAPVIGSLDERLVDCARIIGRNRSQWDH